MTSEEALKEIRRLAGQSDTWDRVQMRSAAHLAEAIDYALQAPNHEHATRLAAGALDVFNREARSAKDDQDHGLMNGLYEAFVDLKEAIGDERPTPKGGA